MEKARKCSSKVVIISMLLICALTANFLVVFAATNEDESTSYFDTLIYILETNTELTDAQYRELLSNTIEENPYFLVSLNDNELDALEKIYKRVFENLLTIHINTNDVSLTFFGLYLLADLQTLLDNIPVDLYVEVISSLSDNQLKTVRKLIDLNAYQEPFDEFSISIKSIVQDKETIIQQTEFPISLLRYNINIIDNFNSIKAYSIHQDKTQELESTVFSKKVIHLKTTTVNGFFILSTEEKVTEEEKPLGLFDFTIDNNRLILSGALLIGVSILISYLMGLALKTKKQVEA